MSTLTAATLLPDERDVRGALSDRVSLERRDDVQTASDVGEVLRAAAVDSAYRQFTGAVLEGTGRPVAVGTLALLFDSPETTRRTFERVAEAAHLRTPLGSCEVAVETVTAPNGMVSYWGFVYLDRTILVVTLDTFDPQEISMTDFRSLVTVTGDRLETRARG